MISVSSPTRVDLAGGTLDLWPLYLLVEKAYVVNFSIDIFTRVEIQKRQDSFVELEASHFSYKKRFSHFQSLSRLIEKSGIHLSSVKKKASLENQVLSFIWPHLQFWKPSSSQGFDLKIFSESPVGGGLGGSSSLCVSFIKAFSQWFQKDLSLKEGVRLASNIEAKILKAPTGTQDYFPAFKAGLYVIEYDVNDFHATSLSHSWAPLFSENTLLMDTGKPHHSGQLNWSVYRSALQGKTDVLKALENLADLSKEVAQVCLEKKWDSLPPLLNREFSLRLSLSQDFVTTEIRHLRDEILNLGAEAVKICGAGGGGSILIWASKKKAKQNIFRFCEKNSLSLLNAKAISAKDI